ncbi:peroxidase 66 [Amborella trichopoda]|nr:peroxidase 66 [Amborella trichopoda]|eukprot:XP_020531315.1 peroxidase 66 [Amborella trichopoda]
MGMLGFLVLVAMVMGSGTIRSEAKLSTSYYDRTCPQVERVVSETVWNASMHDSKVPPRILRMFFHDCFITGCDASVLLDSTPKNQAEKDAPPNVSLRSFYVIDQAKAKLETVCPRTVSCSDILTIAARDAVTLSGGPYWNMKKGRKDGKVSKASNTRGLPGPTFNVSQLLQSFSNRGLSKKDLVILSGGHTIGFSHCSSLKTRIRNFNSSHFSDPTMNPEFAVTLRTQCPPHNVNPNAGQLLDSTSRKFDNNYYKRLMGGKGVFGSDQDLFTDPRTRGLVELFAKDQGAFFREFAASMIKLGEVGVKDKDGEVRINCRIVN